MRYRVTLYNQHAGCGIWAEGRTRPEAFRRAMVKAGEPFMREGGDKATSFRVMFYDHLMKSHWTSPHAYLRWNNGAGIEWRKVEG